MNKKAIIPIILIFVLLLAGTAVAQEPVTATLTAVGENLTVGDPIQLTLAVTHPAGYHVIPPELEANWGDFIIREQAPANIVDNGDGTETTSFNIDARLFAPGEFNTPPLAISVTDGGGQLSEILAPPTALNVNSVLVEGDSELRDIKPQADLPYQNLLPWLIVGGLLAAAAGGAYWWWKRRQAKLALAMIDNRLPHEVALDGLERIEKMRLPQNGRFKEHYTLVADTVRLYMEKTYHIPVMERTTGEIQRSLKETPLSADVARLFIHFLDDSDLVKFSKFKPDVDSAQQLTAQARHIVEISKPIILTMDDVNENDNEDDQKKITRPSGPTISTNGYKQAEVNA